MRAIHKAISKFGLTGKQFIIMLFLFFGIFAFLQFKNYTNEIEREKLRAYNDINTSISSMNGILNNYFLSIRDLLLTISINYNVFKAGDNEETSAFLSRLSEKIYNLSSTIYVVKNDGSIVSSKQALYMSIGNKELEKILKEQSKLTQGISWSEPYYSPMSGNTVAFFLNVVDKNMNVLGTVIVESNLEYLTQSIKNMIILKEQSFVIFTQKGKSVVFDRAKRYIKEAKGVYPIEIEYKLSDLLLKIEKDVTVVNYDEFSFYCKASINEQLLWKTIILSDKAAINKRLEKFKHSFYTNTLLWALALMLVAFLISFFFMIPIRKFTSKMDKVTDFDNLIPLKMTRQDEIGRLAISYNRMMERIHLLLEQNKLVERKKTEYELKMLQSQIGSHFLSNTLACIGSLARQKKTEEVDNTIRALVELLSLSFGKKSEFISLKEELNGLEDYIKIQKVRYGDVFDFTTIISRDFEELPILKLILQPLVENSIFHGIIPKEGRGSIKVKVFVRKKKLLIFVSDNGVGMDYETQSKLLFSRGENKIHDRFTSIGVSNVHERICINYGNASGLKISSKLNVGTVVMVSIPYNENV